MVTLLKEKGLTAPEDEQLHVLPNYVLDLSGEVDQITEPSLPSKLATVRPSISLEDEQPNVLSNYLLELSGEVDGSTGPEVGCFVM